MSLEKEDLRLKMLPDMMERLRLIADVRGKDYAHQAVILLEKAIMGDYHEVSLMLERANKNRKKRESLGLVGKVGVNPESQILEIKIDTLDNDVFSLLELLNSSEIVPIKDFIDYDAECHYGESVASKWNQFKNFVHQSGVKYLTLVKDNKLVK